MMSKSNEYVNLVKRYKIIEQQAQKIASAIVNKNIGEFTALTALTALTDGAKSLDLSETEQKNLRDRWIIIAAELRHAQNVEGES